MRTVLLVGSIRSTARRELGRLTAITCAVAALAVAGRLPYLTLPASPDEGGFLLLASQWRPGTSLYGNYWVDRPPLLIDIEGLADALGGTLALRVIGIVVVVTSVLLAEAICREATTCLRGTSVTLHQVAPVAVVAIFMTTPLFGTRHVDGELLAAPFILCGVLACIRAVGGDQWPSAVRWSMVAGAAATCAAMVKQNSVDVVVFAAVVIVLRVAAGDRRAALRVAVGFMAGSCGAAAVILELAMSRGTSLGGLWDSVVTFRLQAASVIDSNAPEVDAVRFHRLVQAAVASLAPVVVAVLAWQARGRPAGDRGGQRILLDLRWPAYAVIAWEVISIAAGGSYWLHYLLDLVPGMTILAVAAAQRPPSCRRALAGALVAAALSAGAATLAGVVADVGYSSDSKAVAYLRDHARAGDTATVAFGHPNILWDTHLASPYEHLWSLPVRVRDPDLREFRSVLTSPGAPTWVVVAGSDLYSWGIRAGPAERVLETHYHRMAVERPYVIWHINESRAQP